MPQQFILSLIKPDWEILDEIAKEEGVKNFRELYPILLKEGAKTIKVPEDITCNQKKFQNNFNIPHKLEPFYINLACKYSISVSAAIFRFTILPKIINHQGLGR